MAYIVQCKKHVFITVFQRISSTCDGKIKWQGISGETFSIIASSSEDERWIELVLGNTNINYIKVENSVLKDIAKSLK